MSEKIKSVFFITIFLTFIILITKYYFSEKNFVYTNKSRSSYTSKLNENNDNLPLLKNDTNNIIIFKNDLEKFKSKRKKRFWEKLISNKDE